MITVYNRTVPLNNRFSEARNRGRKDLLRLAMLPLLALGASSGASAQAIGEPLRGVEIVSEAARPDTKREGTARFFDPEDGQLDLSYFLEDPSGFLPIPIIVTEPAVGYGGGAAGMFLRPRREAGEEGWARPDISAVGAFGTQNGTWGAFAGDSSRWLDGRLRTLLGAGTGQMNLDFYGLGTLPSSLNQGVRTSLQFAGLVAQANWQLAPESPWSVGLRYVYADVNPKPREDSALPGADQIRVKISAPTAVLEYDTRDNVFTPTRGIYSETSWLASREALGASVDFERFEQVLIGWHPLPNDVTLGVRGIYAWSSDGAPFFLRPFVQLRGVPAARYQGDQAASVELEARWQFHGRWSVVGFGGAGTTRTDRQNFVATQNVGSGGLGFRYKLANKFGMDAGIDLAHSPGTNAVYFVVGNAWFRP
jgi:hypothetical protein